MDTIWLFCAIPKKHYASWEEAVSEWHFINTQKIVSWLCAFGETCQTFRNHGFESTCLSVQSAFSWVKSDALCCLPICVVDITFFAASFPISCSTLRLVSQALSLNSLFSVDSRICYICWLRLEKSSKTIFIPKHIDWAMGVVQNPLQLASSQFLPRPLFTTMFGLSSHCQCPKETVWTQKHDWLHLLVSSCWGWYQ